MAIVPESIQRLRDLGKVRQLCDRLAHPFWMPEPRRWIWRQPDGRPQGFAPFARDEPGLCNLLWLSLDLREPPQVYEAQYNGLYMLLLAGARGARLGGQPLVDMAGVLTLPEFAARLAAEPRVAGGVEHTYPLLTVLAHGRIQHVDT